MRKEFFFNEEWTNTLHTEEFAKEFIIIVYRWNVVSVHFNTLSHTF